MMMQKRFAAIFALLGVILSCAAYAAAPKQAEAAATGSVAPDLEVSAWVQGKEVKLSALKGKKYAVLYFWTISKQGAQHFADMAELAKEYGKKDVAFVGVGIDPADAIRSFDRLKELPFPVAADDRLASVNLYMRERDRIPMAALVGKDGALLWRGRPEQLKSALNEVLEGKFDLKKTIERENFSHSVMNALKIKDYPSVLKLLDSELMVYPDNLELVTLKARVLGTLMGKPDDALKFLEDVISRQPKDLSLYELAFAILKDAKRSKEQGVWYDRLIANFGDRPAVLIKFAQEEMQTPVEDLRLEYVLKLCQAAYAAPKFKDNAEKGMAADEYARSLYYCGRPDKALEIAKEAMVLLQGTPGFERAKASVIYYNNVLTLSKHIK